nr:hypothetical protein [Pseudonocardia acidicola]
MVVGDENGPPTVSVHATAEEAWRALDREIRERCRMRRRPRRKADPDAAARLADAWRAGEPDFRFWNVTAHRLPILLPAIAQRAAPAAR